MQLDPDGCGGAVMWGTVLGWVAGEGVDVEGEWGDIRLFSFENGGVAECARLEDCGFGIGIKY